MIYIHQLISFSSKKLILSTFKKIKNIILLFFLSSSTTFLISPSSPTILVVIFSFTFLFIFIFYPLIFYLADVMAKKALATKLPLKITTKKPTQLKVITNPTLILRISCEIRPTGIKFFDLINYPMD